jgi:cytochrome c oxidase cbb3-type subunit 3
LSEGLRSEDQLRFYQLKVRAREANPYSETGRFIQSLGTRRFIIKYAVVFILGLAAGHAQTTAHNAGRRTFESSCAPCHGLNGKGGEHAPDIATRPDIVGLSDSEILKVLREGKPQAGMPPFTGLGTAKLSNILNYLRFLQGRRRTPTVVGSAEKGKEVFSGKAGCSVCHMVHGSGVFLGPDLSDYGASHSTDEIRSAIVSAEKRPGTHKELAKATTRDGRQISGLVRNEDNLSVQLQAQDGAFYSLEKSDLSELIFDSEPLMSDNYGAKLSKSELDQLVGYLLSAVDAKRDGRVMRVNEERKTKRMPNNE